MQSKQVICPGYDNACKGCDHGKAHYPNFSCSKSCHDGVTCVDYIKYSRKEKIKELNRDEL